MATIKMMIGDYSQMHSLDTVTQDAISDAMLSCIDSVIVWNWTVMQRNLVQDH